MFDIEIRQSFTNLTLKHQHNTTTVNQRCFLSRQVSAVADEPTRRAVSRHTCCKQRWTLSVINLQPNSVDNVQSINQFISLNTKGIQFTKP